MDLISILALASAMLGAVAATVGVMGILYRVGVLS